MLTNIDLSHSLLGRFGKSLAVPLLLVAIGNSASAQDNRVSGVALQRAPTNQGDIEYDAGAGDGDPVIFIHGAFVADTFGPLMDHSSLAGYRLINYHRRGYEGSAPAEDAPGDYVPHASADVVQLLTHLGVESAHVVAHSSGAIIALQLACLHPNLLESLVLIEPPLQSVPSAAEHREKVGGAASRYFNGDVEGAVDSFMQIVSGVSWREDLAAEIPGGPEQAIRNARTFFEFELPGVGAWQCDMESGNSYSGPVLFMQGDRTPGFHAEAGSVIEEWFPQTEDRVISDASHMIMVDNVEDTAKQIADFIDQVR